MATEGDCAICYSKILLPLTLDCDHTFCFTCIKGVYLTSMDDEDNEDGPCCPMCREPIDDELFDHPTVKGQLDMRDPEEKEEEKEKEEEGDEEKKDVSNTSIASDAGDKMDDLHADLAALSVSNTVVKQEGKKKKNDSSSYWLYQGGGGGWWRFDPRCEKDLEKGREEGKDSIKMLICGNMYCMNLDKMVQQRLQECDYDDTGYHLTGQNRSIRRVESKEELETLRVRGIAGVAISQ
ncbi:hypothetical protein PFISCL1PPCAC_20632 [Pristionchus fissidentatus]|uniref:E3 ubiquitin-protein ligase n=1 Tax=Pristionchus fissidentatus TaxID=1538716 RepID=A0AAV5WFE3_9BILA|nr:hypothetical protein PFISCL1PPCAC_20632 [Pristionchus fissidentatus]